MIKILFIGDLNIYGRSFRRAYYLKKSGFKVHTLSHTKVSLDGKIKKSNLIYRIFNKLMIPYDNTKINQTIKSLNYGNEFDIIWIENGINIYPWCLNAIKKYNKKSTLISLSEDDMFKRHNQSYWYLLGLKFYDIVFTTKIYNIIELKKIGAKQTELFHDSFDHEINKPFKLTNKEKSLYYSTVSAIGAYEEDRFNYLLYLAKKGIKVNIWGNGWENLKKIHKNLVVKNRYLYNEEFSKAINASFININFLRKINRDEITTRSLEIPACKAFMRSERTERQSSFLREAIDAEYFSNKLELFQKVTYYLKNEDKRKKIAMSGYKRCKSSNFTIKKQNELIIKNNKI